MKIFLNEDRDKLFPGKVRICDLFNNRYITRKPIYDFLVNNSIKITGKMLDYGCGSMQYRSLFSNISQYIGLDIAGAEQNGFVPDKDIVYYDGKHVPFEDNYFDSAIAIEVFEHVEDVEYGFKELSRILKKDGILLLTVPMTFPLHLEPWDFRRFTIHGLKKMLEDNGFDVISIKGSTPESDTIHRLKIIEMSKKKKFSFLYVFYCNLSFILRKKKNGNNESKLPLGILVECKNRKLCD